MKHTVGITQNGRLVYTNLIDSAAGKRIARQPQLLSLAQEMLQAIAPDSAVEIIEYDMLRPIGYSFVIPTTEQDTVYYARLLRDDVYTRFIKSGKPSATNFLSVIMHRDSDNNYELTDLWIGQAMPPRPGSVDETPESKAYWSEHAFLISDQSLQTQTVTKTCPY